MAQATTGDCGLEGMRRIDKGPDYPFDLNRVSTQYSLGGEGPTIWANEKYGWMPDLSKTQIPLRLCQTSSMIQQLHKILKRVAWWVGSFFWVVMHPLFYNISTNSPKSFKIIESYLARFNCAPLLIHLMTSHVSSPSL